MELRNIAPVARRLAASRLAWLLLLIVIALGYFGSYYRHGINFRDEGGTVVLIAQRLLAGERPFEDVALGYNVLWFYPVVGWFKLFGIDFVLARAWFFALSTVAAVLSFLVVERAGRRPWLAFLVGLLCVLVPGMTFKNYIPLLVLANSLALVHFALGSGTRWGRIATGGAVLGLTGLTRVDLGIFFAVLWLGAVVLSALDRSLAKRERILLLLGGPLLLAALVWALHLPVYLDAKHRGFAGPFLGQYRSWPQKMSANLRDLLPAERTPAPIALPAPAASAPVAPDVTPPAPPAHAGTLRRAGFMEAFRGKDAEARQLAALIHAPLLTLVPLVLWAAARLARDLRAGDSERSRRSLAALLVLGGALTAFPQYFFFRADAPHVSEFSPGFWTGVFSACLLLGASGGDARARLRWPARLLLAVIALHAAVFLWRMLPDRWTGTIAARYSLDFGRWPFWKESRNRLFTAENGVNVFVSRREQEGLVPLLKIIREHSGPEDFLVAYPYHPSVNVLANRRTYEQNVYVDNVTRTRNWDAEAIARFEYFKPAVIVLSDWDVNGHEASRFSLWAAPTKTWIQTHYTYQGTYLEFEVYTRPER